MGLEEEGESEHYENETKGGFSSAKSSFMRTVVFILCVKALPGVLQGIPESNATPNYRY